MKNEINARAIFGKDESGKVYKFGYLSKPLTRLQAEFISQYLMDKAKIVNVYTTRRNSNKILENFEV